MKRADQIKLNFTRNWKFPGRERLARWLKPSRHFHASISEGIVWLADEEIAIYTQADNYIEWMILSTGTYEDEISKLIRISLRPGNVCIDVGANIGLQSIRMAQSVGESGRVFAFEPLIHLQRKFEKNIQLNKVTNVKLFPFALSNEVREADFTINITEWNQGAFSLGGKVAGNETQKVIIKVADNIPEITVLDRLDLIKIDVEGFEYQVLLGLSETIAKHRPRLIFEYDSNYWRARGQDFGECFDLLAKFAYICYQITSAGCEPIKNSSAAKSGNLFCIPS